MQDRTLRSALALAVLLAAVLALYLPGQLGWGRPAAPAAADAGYSYVADLDYWQRSPREQVVATSAAFDLAHDLDNVPLVVGEWQGTDMPETNPGVYMVLEPEQYVQRLYRNPAGRYVWLTLIGGRSARTFHPPEQCYDSYGWRTTLSSHAVPLEDGGNLYGLWVDAVKKETESGGANHQELSYFVYLFPDAKREPGSGIVIFRVTSPLYNTHEETAALQADFVRHFFHSARATEGA